MYVDLEIAVDSKCLVVDVAAQASPDGNTSKTNNADASSSEAPSRSSPAPGAGTIDSEAAPGKSGDGQDQCQVGALDAYQWLHG